MPFYLEVQETVSTGIKRLLLEQIDEAIAALQGENIDEGVHVARKTMKRIRAVLRLVRDSIGKKQYKRENVFFRDTAREIASARDRFVLIDVFDKLVQKHEDTVDADTAKNIHDYLFSQYEAELQILRGETELVERLTEQLNKSKARIEKMTIADTGFASVEGGLGRIYKQGRYRMRKAKKSTSAERLHEWRKSVKYLWHQVEVMIPIWEPMLTVYASELHQLSDYLGSDHDLAILMHTLTELPPEVSNGETIYELIRLIDQERMMLQESAFALGHRIYAESKDDFMDRHERYWKHWKCTRESHHVS